MNCSNCQSNEIIPIVSGRPAPEGLIAERLGFLQYLGLGGDAAEWFCRACRTHFEAGTIENHAQAVGQALNRANNSTAEWLKRDDANRIGIGRSAFYYFVRDFKNAGAKAVRLDRSGDVFAVFEDELEAVEMEWSLAKYANHICDAWYAGPVNYQSDQNRQESS